MRLPYAPLLMMGVCSALLADASASQAGAGPNTPGTLVIHTTGMTYSTDGGVPMCDVYRDNPVSACDAVASNEDQSTVASIWVVLAAFPPELSPRLSGVVFGIDYDDTQTFLTAFQPCGDFELFTQEWPAPGNGTAITWDEAQTGHLTPVYTFAGYHYYDTDASFDLVGHGGPGHPAFFADDAIPPYIDEVTALGSLGFNDNPGSAPCAIVEGPLGACCLPDCSCILVSEADCPGVYYGDGTMCDPNPCSCPPDQGACCFDGLCQITTEADCAWEYLGDDTVCDPNPCRPTPTMTRSWGGIKNTFR